MKDTEKALELFLVSLLIALIYWRFYVHLFYSEGTISFLRSTTGLRIHHYHYGILFISIASIMFILNKINKFSIILMGFGLGSVLDGFISSLLPKTSTRIQEISNYDKAFIGTILLFLIVIVVCIIHYRFGKNESRNRKRNKKRKIKETAN